MNKLSVFGRVSVGGMVAASLLVAGAGTARADADTMDTTTLVENIDMGYPGVEPMAGPVDPMLSFTSIAGRIGGLNLATKTFWVGDLPVDASNATLLFNGQDANLYRLMGSPDITVRGVIDSGLLRATRIDINSGPNVQLQQSAYTAMAVPAFGADALVPASTMSYSGSTHTMGPVAHDFTVGVPDAGGLPLDSITSLSGRLGGLNFASTTFWLGDIPVDASSATILFNGQTANIYRLMGTPNVTARGVMDLGLFRASQIDINSGPAVRLEKSGYSDMALPAFVTGELLPTSYTSMSYSGSTATASQRGATAMNHKWSMRHHSWTKHHRLHSSK